MLRHSHGLISHASTPGGDEGASHAEAEFAEWAYRLVGQPRVIILLAGVVAVLGLVPVVRDPLNQDVSWLAYIAEAVLSGARLYEDLSEVNPPLIVWLHTPAAFFAQILGVSSVPVFLAFVAGLALFSLTLCYKLTRFFTDGWERGLLLLLLTYAFFPATDRDFGQREHLLILLLFPYLLLLAGRLKGLQLNRRLAVIVGVLAGMGVGLKPHFVVAWVALEAFTVLSQRNWRVAFRPESASLMAFGVGYGLVVVLLTPQWHQSIPLISAAYSVGPPLRVLLVNPWTLIPVGATLLALVAPSSSAWRELRQVLLVLVVSLLSVAVWQGKGFPYQYYPAGASGIVLLGMTVLDLVRELNRRKARRGSVILAVGLLTVITLLVQGSAAHALASWSGARAQEAERERAIAEAMRGHGSVAFLSLALEDAFPAVNHAGVEWRMAFPSLWYLPGVYRVWESRGGPAGYHTKAEMGEVERWYFDKAVESITREPPELILVDIPPDSRGADPPFDFVGYFSQDWRFAKMLSAYQPTDTVSGYQIYRRQPGLRQ